MWPFFGILAVFLWASRASCDNHGLLARCAVRLLDVSDSMRTTVYVTMSGNVTERMREELLKAVHGDHKPAVLLNGRFHADFFNAARPTVPRAYLVVARDAADLADHLGKINATDVSWRPEADFVAVLEQPNGSLEPVFRQFSVNHVFASVLVVPTADASAATVDAFAWHPFRDGCGAYHEAELMDTCRHSDRDGGGTWRGHAATVFARRLPDVFRGCTVRVAAFQWPPMTLLSDRGTPRTLVSGMDVEVVKLMRRLGNVRLQLTEIERDERWGVKSADGTWSGGFGKLATHQADLLIGGGIMTAERMLMFDSAPARQVIRFPVYTPLPRKLPYWQNMLNVFSAGFWLTLFAVYLSASGLLWASGTHLPAERRAFAEPAHCLVTTWAILCSVPIGRQPASVSSKMVFLSWAVYALHISAVYTSTQLIYLYRPKYEQPMRTINQVWQSGLSACSVPTFIPISRTMAKENFNFPPFMPCTDMEASVKRLLRRKDIVIVDPEDHFESLVAGSLKKVNKVDEVVIVYNIGIFMLKGNPFKGILKRAQIIAYETGLHNKWRQNASPRPPLKKESSIKVKVLNIDELQGAFIILLCGFSVGSIVFVIELCIGRKTGRTGKKC